MLKEGVFLRDIKKRGLLVTKCQKLGLFYLVWEFHKFSQKYVKFPIFVKDCLFLIQKKKKFEVGGSPAEHELTHWVIRFMHLWLI